MSDFSTNFYVTGGTLRHDAPSYVERQADKDLLDCLLRAEFCYVLTSRQMGKSSLMVRTARKLRGHGMAVAVLDLTAVGHNVQPEQWYGGLLHRLASQLHLEDELDRFWWDNEWLGPCQRFFAAIQKVVLPRLRSGLTDRAERSESEMALSDPGSVAGRLVVFVDELDVVRSLPFSTDEFFAAVRECHTRRAEEPEFGQLTFCLLGVATPSDLIRDTRLTPFNIGKRIELRDFEEQEALALGGALGRPPHTASRMLRRVFHWTSGHPYLTQRLCQAVARDRTATGVRGVDRLCREIFFSSRARERDDNLLFVRERLLRSEVDLINLLRLYRRVHRSTQIAGLFGFRFALRKIEPVADEETNPLVSILRLAGVTKAEKGILRIRNRIYYQVFDPAWAEANMPVAELWRRWLAVWGAIKRAGKFIAGILLVILLSAVALTVWLRPWEMVRIERTRTARHVTRFHIQVPPRDSSATPELLDLSEFYNARLDTAWHPGISQNHIASLPMGIQNFSGVSFDVRGVVQLAGMNLWREGFPESVRGIPVRQRVTRIHFLHGTGWDAPGGIQIANFVVRYENGRRRYIPILYGQDASNWLIPRDANRTRPDESVAWLETAAASSTPGYVHRLYRTVWENPFPDMEVKTIDYVSMITAAAPFLVAITVDPVPSAR